MPVQKNLGMGLNRAGKLLQKIAQGQHVFAPKAVRGNLHTHGRVAQAAGIGQRAQTLPQKLDLTRAFLSLFIHITIVAIVCLAVEARHKADGLF